MTNKFGFPSQREHNNKIISLISIYKKCYYVSQNIVLFQ